MTTYDLSTGNASALGLCAEGLGCVYKLEKTIEVQATGVVASDKLKVFNIPPYHSVLKVVTEVITAAGTTSTISIGTSGTATAYDASVNLNAAEGTIAQSDVAGTDAGIGVVSGTANGIYVTHNHAQALAVYRITALVADLSPKSDSLI